MSEVIRQKDNEISEVSRQVDTEAREREHFHQLIEQLQSENERL